MRTILRSTMAILLTVLLISSATGQNKNPLQGVMIVSKFVKEKVVNEKGEKVWKYKKYKNVQQTRPGDILEYIVKYTNVSRQELRNIDVIGPIPQQTFLLGKTIQSRRAGNLQASIDNGVTYQKPPVVRKVIKDGKEIMINVSEKEWTTLKWRVSKLSPGQYAIVRYCAMVR